MVVLLIAGNLFALEFADQSARSAAMGGAFTAVAQDAIGAFYNPAGLASQRKGIDIQVPFGFNLLTTKDILKEAEEIYKRGNNFSISNKTGSNLTAAEYAKAVDLLKQLGDIDKPGAGILMQGGGALAVRFKNWGISVNSGIYVFADPNVDLQNIAFGVGKNNVSSNDTVLTQLKDFAVIQAGVRGIGGGAAAALTGADSTLAVSLAQMISGSGINLGGGVTAQDLANELVYQASLYKNTLSLTDKDGKTYYLDQSSLNFALPILVQTAIDIETGTSSGNSIDSNATSLAFNGLWLTEVALSYGRENIFKINNLDLGINLKVMKGTTGFYEKRLKDEEFEAEDIKDDFDKTKKETTTFGVDLGLMYSLTDAGKTKIGLVVKNINTPKFDQPDSAIIAGYGKEIELKPQARLGVSFHPWKRVFVTADYDVTKNKTIMKNYKSQIFAAGLELNLLKQEQKNFNIALRGGYKSNLAEKDEGAILTAGIGFGLLHCQLDISGNMSTKKVQNEDGDKIPQAAGVMATLSLNF